MSGPMASHSYGFSPSPSHKSLQPPALLVPNLLHPASMPVFEVGPDVARTLSYEPPLSRGTSPAPAARMPMAVYSGAGTPAPSPPPGNRFPVTVPQQYPVQVEVMSRGQQPLRQHGGRYASRSPPPQRCYAIPAPTGSSTQRAPMTRQKRYVYGSEPQTARATAAVRITRSTSTPSSQPSTQSLPSVDSGRSGNTGAPMPAGNSVVVPAPPRAQSASCLMVAGTQPTSPTTISAGPSSAGVSGVSNVATVPTLGMNAVAAAPWAQVVQPPTARAEGSEIAGLASKILEEVRTTNLLVQSGELGGSRQRLDEMAVGIEMKEKEVREAKELQDSLNAQLSEAGTQLVQKGAMLEEKGAQLVEKESKLQEMSERLDRASEELERCKRDLARVRHDYDCAIATKERNEAESKKSFAQNEARFVQVKQRCHELETIEEELQERVRALSSQKSALESQAVERERDLGSRVNAAAEAARRLEGENRIIEAELEKARQLQRVAENERNDLRCRTAMLEDQLQDAADQRQRAERDQQQAEQDLQQWYQKFIETDKENKDHKKVLWEQKEQNKEHKKELWELDNQLRQERNVVSVSPGGFLKLMRTQGADSLEVENSQLKKTLTKTQCDLDLCVKRLHEQDRRLKELQQGEA